MKIFIEFIIVCFVFIIPQTVYSDDKTPEFDGFYLKTTDNSLVELTEKKGKSYYSKRENKGNRFNDIDGIIPIDTKKIKGFVIKGVFKYDLLTIHHLKYDPNLERHHPYYSGEKIKIRSKRLNKDTYYYQPREPLKTGKYVAWLGFSFWPFEVLTIKTAKEQKEIADEEALYELVKSGDTSEITYEYLSTCKHCLHRREVEKKYFEFAEAMMGTMPQDYLDICKICEYKNKFK